MNCPDFEVLMRYLDGELNPEERESVKAHIDSCPECLRVLESRAELRKPGEITSACRLSKRSGTWKIEYSRTSAEKAAGNP